MKVALVHYWLVGMRGGEKVLEAMCRLWPDADIYAHVYDPGAVSETIRSHRVRTTFIQRLPAARRLYKTYLPLMPYALEALDLSAYDLVISSESGPAKGVVVRPDALHICYCHTPMRYVWDQMNAYRSEAGVIKRLSMTAFIPGLRQWDFLSAARVDRFVANSSFVRKRIEKYYRREATVIHPPVAAGNFSLAPATGDYYLAVGQLVRYKRFDLAVAALTALGRRLIVAGTGEEEKRLRKIAGPNVEFVGWQTDEKLAELMSNCRALVFPGEEDFGIIPVEAMAAGRPVIAYGSGGVLETVLDNKTGLFFGNPSVESLSSAILRFEETAARFDPVEIRRHALTFDTAVFQAKFSAFVRSSLASRQAIAA